MTLDEMIANGMDPNTEVEIPLQEFIKLKKIPVFNMGRIAVNQITSSA